MTSTLLDDLLAGIRQKRKQKFESAAVEYNSIITDLAEGQQVDLDRLSEVLDELDFDDAKLKKDVEAKQKRLQAAKQIAELQKVEKQLPKLRAEHEAAQRELNEAIERLRPLAGKAERALFEAENQASSINHFRQVLRTEGIPMHIRERQDKLQGLLELRREKQQKYDERTANIKYIPSVKQRLTDAEAALKKRGVPSFLGELRPGDPGEGKILRERVAKLKTELEQLEELSEKWQPLKDEIDELTREIDREREAIEAELQKP